VDAFCAVYQELNIDQDTFDSEAAPVADEEMGLGTNPMPAEVHSFSRVVTHAFQRLTRVHSNRSRAQIKSSVPFTHTELRKPQSYSTHHSSVTRNAKVKRPAKHTEGLGTAAKVPMLPHVSCCLYILRSVVR
jgi:hypothetical protein